MQKDLYELTKDIYYDANDIVLEHVHNDEILEKHNDNDYWFVNGQVSLENEIDKRYREVKPYKLFQGGDTCPHCGSTDIELVHPECDYERFHLHKKCHACGDEFVETYQYTKIDK